MTEDEPTVGAENSRPPGVDTLARSLADTGIPHPLLVAAARRAIAEGDPARARAIALSEAEALLRPVINATGILLHTNLGRAPGALKTRRPAGAAIRYNNLEFDTARGERGRRGGRPSELLAQLCGAEAVHVVNNCAAAVTLVLAGMAEGRGVVVSRSELVEIGGGFRVPEVISASGARLVEVGTTNRTRAADYQRVLDEPSSEAALCLKVHQSNYRIVGFTEAASPLSWPHSELLWRWISALGFSTKPVSGSGTANPPGCKGNPPPVRRSPPAQTWSRFLATSF